MPLRRVFNELSKVEFIEKDNRISKTYSIAYEDNRGALELARGLKFRPAKYHHFRHAAARGQIKMLPIDTKN